LIGFPILLPQNSCPLAFVLLLLQSVAQTGCYDWYTLAFQYDFIDQSAEQPKLQQLRSEALEDIANIQDKKSTFWLPYILSPSQNILILVIISLH
jgi:hypothetical protein